MQLLGNSSKFHIACTGLHCLWLPSAPPGAGVMIISCGSHSPPVFTESALQSLQPFHFVLPLFSVPGYRIIVNIFWGGKNLSERCWRPLFLLRPLPGFGLSTRSSQGVSVQTGTIISEVCPGRWVVLLFSLLFLLWLLSVAGRQLHPLPLVHWNTPIPFPLIPIPQAPA